MDTNRVFDSLDRVWEKEFKTQLNDAKDEFVFYEGPPFATGKPSSRSYIKWNYQRCHLQI